RKHSAWRIRKTEPGEADIRYWSVCLIEQQIVVGKWPGGGMSHQFHVESFDCRLTRWRKIELRLLLSHRDRHDHTRGSNDVAGNKRIITASICADPVDRQTGIRLIWQINTFELPTQYRFWSACDLRADAQILSVKERNRSC